jgi:hypothetical protein
MNDLDFCLSSDFGSSDTKFWLFRVPSSVAAHLVPSSCTLISQKDYEFEVRLVNQKWGTGVVCQPSEEGDRYYRIGLDPVKRTADSIKKWESAVCKLLCALGWLSQSSDKTLKGSIKILLPLDEYAYRVPMLKMLAYSLKKGTQVNGQKISNIEIGTIGCEPEGSGLIDSDRRLSSGLMSGHCDLTFILGVNGAIDLSRSFTVSGAGAILPLRLSGLPIFNNEVESAIAFNRQDWSAFARDGLSLEEISAMAEYGLKEYTRSQFKHIHEISNTCREMKIHTVQVGGGSINLNRKLLASAGLKTQGNKVIEQKITRLLGIRDRSTPSRLVDCFLLWSKNPQVARHLEQLEQPTLIDREVGTGIEVLMEQRVNG